MGKRILYPHRNSINFRFKQEVFMKSEHFNFVLNFGLGKIGNYVEKSREIKNLILVFL